MKTFFSDLHRSIFDPNFHKEAVKRSRGHIFLFVLMLLVLTSLVSGIAKAYYFAHHERGVAPIVSELFAGIEIKDGRLVTDRAVPYEMRSEYVAALMSRLAGQSSSFGRTPDNFAVVDTRADAAYTRDNEPRILFGERAVRFADMGVSLPYGAFIGSDFRFTEETVQKKLSGLIASLCVYFIMSGIIFGATTMFGSILFLSLASYIFSIDRSRGFWCFVRLACFSITPVMLGMTLVAVTGVSADWTWHVFIILSTIIMYRAAMRAAIDKPAEEVLK